MPFPSRGCRTCKQRRVKCDEARPACGQCRKLARKCQGFDVEESHLLFKSENVYARGVARRPRKPNVTGSQKVTSQSKVTLQNSQVIALKQIPRTLDVPLEYLAFNHYVQDYMFSGEHLQVTAQSWLERTTAAQQEASSDSLLASIVLAVSLATSGRTQANTGAILLGRGKYMGALAKTKTAVGNADEATTDQFLLAVMMLGVYEHAMSDYDKKSVLAEGSRHQDGAMAILRLRKDQNRMATPLDQLVRQMIVKQAVLHAVDLPAWIWDGADFGEEGVHLGLNSCLVRLALLRNHAQELWRDAKNWDIESLQLKAQTVVAEARSVDDMLAEWMADMPPNWTYTTQRKWSARKGFEGTESPDPERLRYDSTVSLYPDLEQAVTWNRYRASRIVTNGIVGKVLSFYESASHLFSDRSTGKSRIIQLEAHVNVQRYVDEICASVPYHFDVTGSNGDILIDRKPRIDQIGARRADLLSWPLTIAMTAGGIPEHQRQWIRSKILQISKITGSGSLELIANMDQYPSLQKRFS